MAKKSRIEDVAVTKYLQTCDIPVESFKVEPFTLVIFGGTGDLSRKKLLPALFHIYLGKDLPERFSILSVGGSKLEDDSYRTLVERALRGPTRSASARRNGRSSAPAFFTYRGTWRKKGPIGGSVPAWIRSWFRPGRGIRM